MQPRSGDVPRSRRRSSIVDRRSSIIVETETAANLDESGRELVECRSHTQPYTERGCAGFIQLTGYVYRREHRVGDWNMGQRSITFLAALSISGGACNDPPGDIGGLVVVVRTFEAPAGSRFENIERVIITYDQVDILHRATLGGDDSILVS